VARGLELWKPDEGTTTAARNMELQRIDLATTRLWQLSRDFSAAVTSAANDQALTLEEATDATEALAKIVENVGKWEDRRIRILGVEAPRKKDIAITGDIEHHHDVEIAVLNAADAYQVMLAEVIEEEARALSAGEVQEDPLITEIRQERALAEEYAQGRRIIDTEALDVPLGSENGRTPDQAQTETEPTEEPSEETPRGTGAIVGRPK
jgi:hypothetical protein